MTVSVPAKVAIVTRTKNRPVMLRRAIESVIGQTFANWKHYIVNDGGNPSLVEEVAAEFGSLYANRLEIIHNPTAFTMEAASNAGLVQGKEEYFSIHDDDDSWHESFLLRTVSRLDQLSEDSTYGGVATQARVIVERDAGGTIEEISNHIFEPYTHVSFMDMLWRNRFPPICLLARRTVMEEIGFFDTSLRVLGDWDFHLRLYRHFKVEIIPEPLAHYHHRPSGLGDASNSVYRDAEAHRRNLADYIDKVIKEQLANGSLGYGDLMLHARGMDMLDRVETNMQRKLDEMKNDILFELKAHIDWRLGQAGDKQ